MTRPLASPMVRARVVSFRRTRPRWAADISPRASPRTTTVAVWVVPMPPMETTIGMNRATRASSRIEFSQALREDHPGRGQDGLVAGRPSEALDVLGGLLPDDVNDVVDRDHPQQAMVAVDHHVEDRGGLGHRRLPDLLDRLGHREVLKDREHVRGHEPSGGLFAV